MCKTSTDSKREEQVSVEGLSDTGIDQYRPRGFVKRTTPEDHRDKEIIEALKLISAGKKKLEGLLKK